MDSVSGRDTFYVDVGARGWRGIRERSVSNKCDYRGRWTSGVLTLSVLVQVTLSCCYSVRGVSLE